MQNFKGLIIPRAETNISLFKISYNKYIYCLKSTSPEWYIYYLAIHDAWIFEKIIIIYNLSAYMCNSLYLKVAFNSIVHKPVGQYVYKMLLCWKFLLWQCMCMWSFPSIYASTCTLHFVCFLASSPPIVSSFTFGHQLESMRRRGYVAVRDKNKIIYNFSMASGQMRINEWRSARQLLVDRK